jgi:hypothetical protein
VEDADGAVTVLHALEKASDGLLVVRSGERGGEVETVGPSGGERGAASQADIVLESSLDRSTTDDKVLETLAPDANADLGALLTAYLKLDLLSVVDEPGRQYVVPVTISTCTYIP